MVQASVGYQCPECTHARPQKVVSGAAAFASGAEDVVIGKALIGLNVIAYVATVVTGGSLSATGPLFQHGVAYGPAIAAGEWWRIITGGFLHASPLHLLMNMFLLWLLSKELEPAVGHVRFALLYLVSLVGGAVGVMLLSADQPTLGASGAIFGLMGALVVLQLRAKQNPWNSGLGGLIVINLVLTFAVPNISIGGHIGGLLAGALAGALVEVTERPNTTPGIREGFMALTAVLLAGLAIVAAGALSTQPWF